MDLYLPPEQQANWVLEPMPPTGPMPEVSAADQARGYVVFHRPWPECLYPNTAPRPEEMNPELRIFATPGEYEPLTVAVRGLREVAGLTCEPSDIGPIRAADIDVRHVRYMRARPNYTTVGRQRIVPDVLEPTPTIDVPEGQTDRFWLTVRVPEDAAPGEYSGQIRLASAEGGSATVPVRLRVLPIQLAGGPVEDLRHLLRASAQPLGERGRRVQQGLLLPQG